MQKVNGSKIGHITWSLDKLKGMQQASLHRSSLLPQLNGGGATSASLTHLNQSGLRASSASEHSINRSNTTVAATGGAATVAGVSQDDLVEFRYYSCAGGTGKPSCYASSITLRVIGSNGDTPVTISSSSSSSSSFESFVPAASTKAATKSSDVATTVAQSSPLSSSLAALYGPAPLQQLNFIQHKHEREFVTVNLSGTCFD